MPYAGQSCTGSGVYPMKTGYGAELHTRWDASPSKGTMPTQIHTKGQFILVNQPTDMFLGFRRKPEDEESHTDEEESMWNMSQIRDPGSHREEMLSAVPLRDSVMNSLSVDLKHLLRNTTWYNYWSI